MWVFDLFDKNACSIGGINNGLESWTWKKYYKQKEILWDKIVLVDMIDHPVDKSIPLSDELFAGKYPDGTIFVLYCHSGATSGHVQKKLAPQFPQFRFVNMSGGICSLK